MSTAGQGDMFAMLGALASQFEDDDGQIERQMTALKQQLDSRDAVVASHCNRLAGMVDETAGTWPCRHFRAPTGRLTPALSLHVCSASPGDADTPTPAQMREMQSQLLSVEDEIAEVQRLLADDDGAATGLLAATMAGWCVPWRSSWLSFGC